MKLKPQSDKNKKILEKEKRFCGCNHKDPDYWCVCWLDGFETADSENCFEKLQEEREKGKLEGMELANEDWYQHLDKGISSVEIYEAIKENIESFKSKEEHDH